MKTELLPAFALEAMRGFVDQTAAAGPFLRVMRSMQIVEVIARVTHVSLDVHVDARTASSLDWRAMAHAAGRHLGEWVCDARPLVFVQPDVFDWTGSSQVLTDENLRVALRVHRQYDHLTGRDLFVLDVQVLGEEKRTPERHVSLGVLSNDERLIRLG